MSTLRKLSIATPPVVTPRILETDGEGEAAIAYAHYFIGGCDWLITEYDPESTLAFGWACLGERTNAELGYIDLAELDAIRIGPGLRVDMETDWEPCPLADAIALLDARAGHFVTVTR